MTIFALVPLCERFLSRMWYAFDGSEQRGAEFNALLDELLRGYFKDAGFSFIGTSLEWIMNDLTELTAQNGILNKFPCFKK